jgi:hypothetical protein
MNHHDFSDCCDRWVLFIETLCYEGAAELGMQPSRLQECLSTLLLSLGKHWLIF